MDHIYRVSKEGRTFYAIERGGELRRASLGGESIFDGFTAGEAIPGGIESVKVLAPVVPSKIVCVGQNYRDHVAEMKYTMPTSPVLFYKPPSALLDPRAPIKLPPGVTNIHHEAELAVVIGRRAHRVPRAR